MSSATAENDWLKKAGAGDRAAFDALLGATAPAVWSLLRRLTRDEATAEDAMQETYVAAWSSAASFRDDGNARAWLYGIARRQAARTWRRRSGEPSSTATLAELAQCAGWGDDPEVLAARAEDRVLLLHALSTLSDSDQELITRCDLEGLPPRELAEALDLAPGTVRVRLHRARLRLLAALRQEHNHE